MIDMLLDVTLYGGFSRVLLVFEDYESAILQLDRVLVYEIEIEKYT